MDYFHTKLHSSKSSEWGHLGPLPPYRFLFSKYWQIWSQTPSKQEITQVLGIKKKKKKALVLKGKFFVHKVDVSRASACFALGT